VGEDAAGFVDEFGAADAGHDEIGEEEVDVGGVEAADAQGFFAVLRGEDEIALGNEIAADGFAEGFFVFHEENGFVAFGVRSCGDGASVGERSLVRDGKKNFEFGAGVGFAEDADGAAMLFDDAVDGGEAEAGAFAGNFGGEERFEDVRFGFGTHAGAGVFDGEDAVAAGSDGDAALEAIVDADVEAIECDGERAAFGKHGVAGVDDEIHEHLFELAGIGVDVDGGRVGADVELDFFADEGWKHFAELGDQLVEVEEF
jgi:hypothetical protein